MYVIRKMNVTNLVQKRKNSELVVPSDTSFRKTNFCIRLRFLTNCFSPLRPLRIFRLLVRWKNRFEEDTNFAILILFILEKHKVTSPFPRPIVHLNFHGTYGIMEFWDVNLDMNRLLLLLLLLFAHCSFCS